MYILFYKLIKLKTREKLQKAVTKRLILFHQISHEPNRFMQILIANAKTKRVYKRLQKIEINTNKSIDKEPEVVV